MRIQRRLTLAAALVAASVIVICLFAAREWIADRYYLFKLSRAAPEERLPYIQLLFDRGCAAVTPHLLRYWKDNRFKGSVTMTLGDHGRKVSQLVSLGPYAVPHLAEAIEGDEATHWVVFDALTRHGRLAAPAVPNLMRYLERGSSARLHAAIEVLGAIGEEASPAVPVLLGFRRHPAESVRWRLYLTLGQIGPAAHDAVPILVDAITFETGEILVYASVALERIEPGRPEALQGLRKALSGEDSNGREYAADALPGLGPRAKEASPDLIRLLKSDPEEDVTVAAAKALDRLDAETGLKEALLLGPREQAAVLGGFVSRGARVTPILIDLTKDEDQEIAQRAVASLGRLGIVAAPAIPRLVEVCKSSAPSDLVSGAAKALGQIGIASSEVLETFFGLLPGTEDDPNRTAPRAIAGLVESTKDPQPVIAMLLRALQADRRTCRGALTAFAWVGPAAAEAVPALRAIAADASDPELSDEATYALGNVASRTRKGR